MSGSVETWVCGVSARAERLIANPWSVVAYIGARIVMTLTLKPDLINVVLSDFSCLALLLMANAGARRASKQERQLDELARVNPDIDERAIEEAAR